MTMCHYDNTEPATSSKVPTHSLISPRFLKSQPALSSVVWRTGASQRLLKSQPFMSIGSSRQRYNYVYTEV